MDRQPFDDIRDLVRVLPPAPADRAAGSLAAAAEWVRAWSGQSAIRRPILAVFAAAHAGEPPAGARARLEALASGEAPSAIAAAHLGAGLEAFDLALDQPTSPADEGAPLSERACAATLAFGMDVLAKQPDLLLLQGFGPGTALAAARLLRAFDPADDAGDDPVVQRARAEAKGDALELLRALGGRDLCALAGAVIAARSQMTPVLLCGPQALAAAVAVHGIDPAAAAHCRTPGAPGGPVRGLGFSAGDAGEDPAVAGLAAIPLIRLGCALSTT